MMTTAAVKSALKSLNGKEIDSLSANSGVPSATIYKIRSGETPDPRGSTIEALSGVLDQAAADVSPEPQKEAA